ncbi:MAG: hypothetical protein JNJ88_05825 [Planctomycetes bacterium]|nr:hypothetical protein [Planctomycetota bacterium]
MPQPTHPRSRSLTIVAQDPSVLGADGDVLLSRVDLPGEPLLDGPSGHRVQIVDFDATKALYYPPTKASAEDLYAARAGSELIRERDFHAQNVYAIVMSVVSRFEFALGRRAGWAFPSHQIQAMPHAFADANAFYSRRDHGLFFGYFSSADRKSTVYSCLSHDVIAHETTHALLDGLRPRYTDPSSPDQAAFHEGFSDIVAILSVFSLKDVVRRVLSAKLPAPRGADMVERISKRELTPEKLAALSLLCLAEQMGKEMGIARGGALRASATLAPSKSWLSSREFSQPHRRGEVLVAAVLHAFLLVWRRRIIGLGGSETDSVSLDRVVEEGAAAAARLLSTAIRALDYSPPVDLQFGDFLSAMLTGEGEVLPDDRGFSYRSELLRAFREYGIEPTARGRHALSEGAWSRAPRSLQYAGTHFESLQRDPDEVFRFLWQNRDDLGLEDEAFTKVQSVRPCVRVGEDGFVLRETVAEYVQHLEIRADDLSKFGVRKPAGIGADQQVELFGGGCLIFDEFGRLKYHISKKLLGDRHNARLRYLAESGHFAKGFKPRQGLAPRTFASLHRRRALDLRTQAREAW